MAYRGSCLASSSALHECRRLPMATIYATHEHDVIVIGAGGAGLRAAIEAAAQGVSVGLICTSLLGKAHTVMAGGGIAAALGNVWPEDNWQVHFRDTMRGGKTLNNWRMAQLHAQEAPERVLELERWGALSAEGLAPMCSGRAVQSIQRAAGRLEAEGLESQSLHRSCIARRGVSGHQHEPDQCRVQLGPQRSAERCVGIEVPQEPARGLEMEEAGFDPSPTEERRAQESMGGGVVGAATYQPPEGFDGGRKPASGQVQDAALVDSLIPHGKSVEPFNRA